MNRVSGRLRSVVGASVFDRDAPRVTLEGSACLGDRALVELDGVVLRFFQSAGVRVFDHYRRSDLLMHFETHEEAAGGPVHAHRTWIVPPLSGNPSPVCHGRVPRDVIFNPNRFHQGRGCLTRREAAGPDAAPRPIRR